MAPTKRCFLCCTHLKLVHESSKIKELFSSNFVHPLFPISPSELTSSIPCNIRICEGCLVLVKGIIGGTEEDGGQKDDANEKDKSNNKFQEIMRKVRLSKTKFNKLKKGSKTSMFDLRDKIMYPCDFGSSNFGFSTDEVRGEFGKLPDEMLDKIFSYLDPTSLKNIRQVSSFMRTKSLTAFHLGSPIHIDKWLKDEELLTWPHLFSHRNWNFQNSSMLFYVREQERIRAEEILGGCGDGGTMKKFGLKYEILEERAKAWLLNYVFPVLKHLESLEISLKIEVKDFQVPNWETIFDSNQRLKVVSFSSKVPGIKEFMKATRGVRTLNLRGYLGEIDKYYVGTDTDWVNQLIEALEDSDSLWPNLESFSWRSVDNTWNKGFLECLGPRPIRHVDITISYNMLDTFHQFLENYGDTLESVGVTLSLGIKDAWLKQFKDFELPDNLGKLKAFTYIISEPRLMPNEWDQGVEMCGRCKLRSEGFVETYPPLQKSGGKKWDFSRDFFNFGKLLKDPELFYKKLPNLRHLSLFAYPESIHPIKCESCMKLKKAICEDVIPQGAFNPRLVTLECSYPTREEGEMLYEEWRERLRAAFPNSGIIQGDVKGTRY